MLSIRSANENDIEIVGMAQWLYLKPNRCGSGIVVALAARLRAQAAEAVSPSVRSCAAYPPKNLGFSQRIN